MKNRYLMVGLLFLSLMLAETMSVDILCVEGLEPCISKWAFYSLCDFGYDPLTHPRQYPLSLDGPTTFDPKDVLPGSCIFIRGRSSSEFFRTIAPKITVPYCIVAHGEYLDAFQESYVQYLDNPMLIAWFGTHPCEIKHPKFYQIPLGLHPRNSISKSSSFSTFRNRKKKGLVYANFSVMTHPERSILLEQMKSKDFCYCAKKCSHDKYLSQMASSKFTLSPRGLGIDCYRTWEALLVGSIPIVKSSRLDSFYADLPVLIVDDWSCITREFLEEKYLEITSRKWSREKLFISYWAHLIESVKEEFLRVEK